MNTPSWEPFMRLTSIIDAIDLHPICETSYVEVFYTEV